MAIHAGARVSVHARARRVAGATGPVIRAVAANAVMLSLVAFIAADSLEGREAERLARSRGTAQKHRYSIVSGETGTGSGGGSSCRPAPATTATTEYSDIVYAMVPRGDGNGLFGLMLDVHVPSPGNRYPALIYLHGGGWVAGSRTGRGGTGGAEYFARLYAVEGPFVVFNVDYRMPCDPANPSLEYFDDTPHLSPRAAICSPETHIHPVPLADVRAAIAWVVINGARFNADVQKIGVIGDSAGAHLAALAATYDGPALLAGAKPDVAVGFSPPLDFDFVAMAGLTNNGTPSPPVPIGSSPDGAEFDACAFVKNVPELGGWGWTNTSGTNCGARWHRAVFVGQDYYLGPTEEQIASRDAWNQASPRYWVGSTQPLNPDTPVYIIGGVGESRFLEQEGVSFMSAAADVPSMSGSGFCALSPQNTQDKHGANCAGSPVEAGCFGYDPNAATQVSVLQSTLLYLRKHIPQCP